MTATKILIVEDDAALLRGLKDNFRAHGYQVRTANDGEKGLEALLRDPPDLALLDVMLPKVNGYEICRLARSRRLRTAILMLSAKCQEDDVVRGLELGADDYVTKPFGIRELLARAKLLSRRGNSPAPQLPDVPPGLGVRQPSGAFDNPSDFRQSQRPSSLQDAVAPPPPLTNSEGAISVCQRVEPSLGQPSNP
jgi:DNA-binding response OmpR family regulator